MILDVVFNHTAEGNEQGPSFSFQRVRQQHLLHADARMDNYYNFSGCGNALNCNQPIVQQMILECLRYWTVTYRVDGFRFDLASILGRNEDGSPLERSAVATEIWHRTRSLSRVKLIAEAWDAGGHVSGGKLPVLEPQMGGMERKVPR